MNDTMVTVVGNVVDSPRRVSLENGAVTNFRMAATARRYDNRMQEFVDAGTFWVDVECWNGLSGNVAASVSKGDPVIVHGALTTHSWESENGRRSTPRVRAFAVGPNLTRGTALFRRDRSARPAEAGESRAAEGPTAAPDEPSVEPDALVRGQDYEDAAASSYRSDADDFAAQPAHA